MNSPAYKIGSRLARIGYVKNAIADRADLSAFRERPDWRIFLGMFLIAFSFAMCWPVITALGGVAAYYHHPSIFFVGGTIVYFLSHLCFIAGMALSGEKFTRIFFRWLTRVGVEKLLSGRPVEVAADVDSSD